MRGHLRVGETNATSGYSFALGKLGLAVELASGRARRDTHPLLKLTIVTSATRDRMLAGSCESPPFAFEVTMPYYVTG